MDDTDSFRITFKNREKERITREDTRGKTGEETRERIIDLMRKDPEITMDGLSKIIGLSEKGIEWQIKRLKKLGMVKREGPKKGGHWKVIEE